MAKLRPILIKGNLVLLFLCNAISGIAQQWGDYTLYSLQNGTSTQLIDTNNLVFKTWTHGNSARTGYSSYLMPGGVLWRSVNNTGNALSGGGVTGRIQKISWDGTLLWDFTYSGLTYCLHHDFCPLPNGNVLLISYDVKSATEAVAAGCSTNISIWSEKVIEVKPNGATGGTIVWEWKLWDHLVQDLYPEKSNYQTSVQEHPELLNINFKSKKDWIHMNGIDYNPILDQIALSSHNLNEWYIIDHSTSTAEAASHQGGNSGKGGDFLYRYGNPSAYGMSGSTVLNVTHDAHWIPEGVPNAGRLVGFNNKGISSNRSSVDQIDLPQTGYTYERTSGNAFTPASYTERHACNGGSQNMSNSQQLPNGNMLVCIAQSGLIYEVNPAGNTIWSFSAAGNVPQAFRYSACYLSLEESPIPVITVEDGRLVSSSAASYQWYRNGQLIPEATLQTYEPTSSGIYLVRTSDSSACAYQYAQGLKYELTVTGMHEANHPELFKIFPNPGNGQFYIQSDTPVESIRVWDTSGRSVSGKLNNNCLDLSHTLPGVYFLEITNKANETIYQKVLIQN